MSYQTRFIVLNQALPGHETKKNPAPSKFPIYRPGKNPLKETAEESEDETIPSSYHISNQLDENQEPTFVDVLQERIDPTGKPITKDTLIQKSTSNHPRTIEEPIIPKPEIQKPIETLTTNYDSESSVDLDNIDINNLTIPKTNLSTLNENDEFRERTLNKLQEKKNNEEYDGPTIVKTEVIKEEEEEEEEEESETDESEQESSSSEESINESKPKIVFLNKNDRENLMNEMKKNNNIMSMEDEWKLINENNIKREKELKIATKEDLYEYIRKIEKGEFENKTDEKEEVMPDDNIYDHELEDEYNKWKIREIKRIKREQEIKLKHENEKYELMKRRKMTDTEIIRDNKKYGIKQPKEKTRIKFMQKYYHKGAFFNDGDDDEINRDIVVEKELVKNNRYMEPTGKDKYTDYSKLRDIQKKKRFGLMSQSKWTHLMNEDTTQVNDNDRKNGEYYKFRQRGYRFDQNNDKVIKRGGQGGFDRPSWKRNKKNKKYHSYRRD